MNTNASRNGRAVLALAVLAVALCAVCVAAPESDAADTTVETHDEFVSALKNASAGDTITVTGDITISKSVSAKHNVNLVVADGGSITVENSAKVNIKSGGTVTVENGGWVHVSNVSLILAGSSTIDYGTECMVFHNIDSVYSDFETALEVAQWDEFKNGTLYILGSVEVTSDATVPIWLRVPDGGSLRVTNNSTLAATANLTIDDGSRIYIENGSSITNGTDPIAMPTKVYIDDGSGVTYTDFKTAHGGYFKWVTVTIVGAVTVDSDEYIDETVNLKVASGGSITITNSSRLDVLSDEIVVENGGHIYVGLGSTLTCGDDDATVQCEVLVSTVDLEIYRPSAGEQTYTDFASAISLIQEGDTVTVQKNVTVDSDTAFPGENVWIYVELNASITVTNGATLNIGAGGYITIYLSPDSLESDGYVSVEEGSSLTAGGASPTIRSYYYNYDTGDDTRVDSDDKENGELTEEGSGDGDDASGTDYRPALVVIVVVIAAAAVAVWNSRRGA